MPRGVRKNQDNDTPAAPATGAADDRQGDAAFRPVSEPVSEKPKDALAQPSAPSRADKGGADGMVICNNGKQNEVLILDGVRKILAPREIWRIPAELTPAFEKYRKTPYFQAVEAEGIFTLSGAVTRKMRDPDMTAVKTPEPPPAINPEVEYGDRKTTVEMTPEEN